MIVPFHENPPIRGEIESCHEEPSNSQVGSISLHFHRYILDVIDMKVDGHYGYLCIATLLGMDGTSWSLVRMDLLKELDQ